MLKTYDLNVLAFYKKGKADKLNADNIRFIIEETSWYPASLSVDKNALVKVDEPRFTPGKDDWFLNEPNLMTGIKGKDGPEGMGTLESLIEDITTPFPDTLKFKNYNYYKLEDDDPDLEGALKELFGKYGCFKHN